MNRQNNLCDASVFTQGLTGNESGLGVGVTSRAESHAVVEVVAAVRKQPPFYDVVSVYTGFVAMHTRVPVSGEYCFAELVSG
jgi:hypothetical protein